MKKVAFLLWFTFLFLIIIFPVDASTNTKIRTEEDYLVPSYITVTDSNRSNVLSTPAVDASEKIYDFADLLSDSEEEKLYKQAKKYIENTNFDLAIVTVSNYEKDNCHGNCTHTYADDFYDYNEFGLGSEHSGVLFLVDMSRREIYMTTTGEAISMYNDNRIDMIMDSIYQAFSSQNYYQGIAKFMTILENYDTMGLPNSKDSRYVITEDGTIARDIPWLIFLGIPIFITGIVMAILISKNKLVRVATSSREYLDKKTLKTSVVSDQLVHTHTSVTRIQSSSSGGSGVSSTHSGSSGVSHGGGGHRF